MKIVGRHIFEFVTGALAATVGSLIVSALLFGLLQPMGFAIVFLGPILILIPIFIFAPVVATLFTKRLPFALGALASVAIEIALPSIQSAYIANMTAKQVAENRAIKPMSSRPEYVVLDCFGQCYFVIQFFLSQSDLPLIVLNNGGQKNPMLVTKRPAAQCMNSSDDSSVWNEYLVGAGYIDWCLGFEQVTLPQQGILFEMISSELSNLGQTLQVTEISNSNRRVLTLWQSGSVYVKGFPPFGVFFSKNVGVGDNFGYVDVMGRVLGLALKDEIKPASNRDPMRQAKWALMNIASEKTGYIASSTLSNSMRELSAQQGAEISKEIVSMLGSNNETDERLMNALWNLTPKDRTQFADMLVERGLKANGPDAGLLIALQTPGVDLSRYSRRALETFDAMIFELRLQKAPGQYADQKNRRFVLLFQVLSTGTSGERKLAIEHLSMLDGDALGAVIGSMTYFSNGNGDGGRQLGWTDLEMQHWIDLSDRISGPYLAHYINALRFSDAGRELRPIMLEKIKDRLPVISDPEERRIMERLIEVIPTDTSS